MTVTAAQQSRSPLNDSARLSQSSQVLSQSREVGEAIPNLRAKHEDAVTLDKAVAKPWAHFIGGAYETRICVPKDFADI